MDGDAAFFIVDPETDENAATFDDATGPIANIKKTEKTRAAAMVYRRIIRNTPTIIISWSCWSSIVDVDDRRRRASASGVDPFAVRAGCEPYKNSTNRSKI